MELWPFYFEFSLMPSKTGKTWLTADLHDLLVVGSGEKWRPADTFLLLDSVCRGPTGRIDPQPPSAPDGPAERHPHRPALSRPRSAHRPGRIPAKTHHHRRSGPNTRFHFFTVKPRSTFADDDLIYRSGDHVGRRQFCGGRSRPTLARTPLRPLWELQRPQTRWHHGRRRPFQIWRGRVCGVMAGGRKRGLFSAAPAPSLCILLVPRHRQSQVPGPSRVSEDQTVGVPEVSPCGGLYAILQVSQTRSRFHRPPEGDVGAVQNYQPCHDPESP